MKSSSNSNILQSVDLALEVVNLIAHEPHVTLSELAKTLGETKPRILRVLRTLEQRGFVRRINERFYYLGISALVLGTAAANQIDLLKVSTPILEMVGTKINETVQLRIVENSTALCISKYEPPRDLRVRAVVGRRRPLYFGSRKILLAFLPAATQMALLPEGEITVPGHSSVSKQELMRELEDIRKKGYCVSRREIGEPLIGIGVPVLTENGSLLAAINISAPAFRTHDEDIERYISLLQDASAQLARKLRSAPVEA